MHSFANVYNFILLCLGVDIFIYSLFGEILEKRWVNGFAPILLLILCFRAIRKHYRFFPLSFESPGPKFGSNLKRFQSMLYSSHLINRLSCINITLWRILRKNSCQPWDVATIISFGVASELISLYWTLFFRLLFHPPKNVHYVAVNLNVSKNEDYCQYTINCICFSSPDKVYEICFILIAKMFDGWRLCILAWQIIDYLAFYVFKQFAIYGWILNVFRVQGTILPKIIIKCYMLYLTQQAVSNLGKNDWK